MIFRNDDVDFDTDVNKLKYINRLFARYGFKQIHCVMLYGICTVPEGAMSKLDNVTIKARGGNKRFADNVALVKYLNKCEDEIALHGLYHIHYKQLSYDLQLEELKKAYKEIQELFPQRTIRYFVPPFDEYNEDTIRACHETGLNLLFSPNSFCIDLCVRDKLCIPKNINQYDYIFYHHKRYYPNPHVQSWTSNFKELEKQLQIIATLLDKSSVNGRV